MIESYSAMAKEQLKGLKPVTAFQTSKIVHRSALEMLQEKAI
jgi:ATP sulfurylase